LAFARSGLGRSVLGPVPAKKGDPVCMYFDSAPRTTEWLVLNTRGERVASLQFSSEVQQCWATQGVAPGIYFVRVKVNGLDGRQSTLVQKLAITSK
jgi:hypothetical protein